MTKETDRYTYRVMWSEEDGEYVGLCAEFGLLSHLDDTPEKAFSGIRDLVAFCVDDLRKEGAPVPEPFSHSELQWTSVNPHTTRDASSFSRGRSRGWSQYEPLGQRATNQDVKSG